MTATTEVEPLRAQQKLAAWYHALHPTYRLSFRWALIVVATMVAFRASTASMVATTQGGGLGGFIWTVPVAGILVAVAISRRHLNRSSRSTIVRPT